MLMSMHATCSMHSRHRGIHAYHARLAKPTWRIADNSPRSRIQNKMRVRRLEAPRLGLLKTECLAPLKSRRFFCPR